MKSYDYETYYDLEIEKLVLDVNKNKYQKVLLQFPDGLKHFSKQVIEQLNENTKECDFFIYFGTCFGACDIPVHLDKFKFDLCVQFGHSVYIKKKDMW